MGGWNTTRPRALAGTVPRRGIGNVAGRMVLALPAGSGRVSIHLSDVQHHAAPRLASYVLDRHRSSAFYGMDPCRRVRKSGVARTPPGGADRTAAARSCERTEVLAGANLSTRSPG